MRLLPKKPSALWDVGDELPPAFPGQELMLPPSNYNGPPAEGCNPCGTMAPEVDDDDGAAAAAAGASAFSGQRAHVSETRTVSRGSPSSASSVPMKLLILGVGIGVGILCGLMCACIWMKKNRDDIYDGESEYDMGDLEDEEEFEIEA